MTNNTNNFTLDDIASLMDKKLAESNEVIFKRFDELTKRMDKRFGEMDKRFGEMDARFDNVTDMIQAAIGDADEIASRKCQELRLNLEPRIEKIEKKVLASI